MHTMDDNLLELVEQGAILAEEAMLRAENKAPFKQHLEQAEE
jgi:Tfp pilus assembly ATPase PilU